jgi:hypothetical protein
VLGPEYRAPQTLALSRPGVVEQNAGVAKPGSDRRERGRAPVAGSSSPSSVKRAGSITRPSTVSVRTASIACAKRCS